MKIIKINHLVIWGRGWRWGRGRVSFLVLGVRAGVWRDRAKARQSKSKTEQKRDRAKARQSKSEIEQKRDRAKARQSKSETEQKTDREKARQSRRETEQKRDRAI
jgi:hypothetical protein